MIKAIIFITSCDLYKDCWEPIVYSFRKHWPDCPYPLYILSNYEGISNEEVIYLKVGKHLGWGSNAKKALKNIDCEYLFHFHEDYFLDCNVDTTAIEKHIFYCDVNKIDYLRLSRPFRDNDQIEESGYCKDKIGKRYALCMQPCIWRKSVYESFCIEGWSCWDFERKINRYILAHKININAQVIHSRTFPQQGLYIVPGTGIRKGRWTREALRFLEENGFLKLIPLRKIEGPVTTFLMKIDNKVLRYPRALLIRLIQKTGINI